MTKSNKHEKGNPLWYILPLLTGFVLLLVLVIRIIHANGEKN